MENDVKGQVAIQNLLRVRLAEIQKTNPRYSLRSYAKKVGVHVGALSHIFNGKRNVSRELAERITRRLCLDPQERSEILGLFPARRRNRKPGTDLGSPEQGEVLQPRYLELSASQFKIASEWEHFAVLSLIHTKNFKSDAASIALRLGLTENRARQVVARLLELGLVELDSELKLRRTAQAFRTSDDVASLSMKKHHEQSLDLAKESLYRDSVEDRDFTTLTMAIDLKKLSTAKELIRKFQDELSDLLESGNQTEVFRLSVQLFPLTQLENKIGVSHENEKK